MSKYLTLKSLYSVKSYTILLLSTIIMFAILLLSPITTRADTTTIPLCEITRNLKVGDSGVDVQCLQRYLNWSGHTVATSGAGSPGNESTYFGKRTKNAVIQWQNANASNVLTPIGLSAGTGYWGHLSFDWYVNIVKVQLALSS